MDVILAPLGWMTVIWTSVVIALLAEALGVSSNTFGCGVDECSGI
jgi:hypothetical protein